MNYVCIRVVLIRKWIGGQTFTCIPARLFIKTPINHTAAHCGAMHRLIAACTAIAVLAMLLALVHTAPLALDIDGKSIVQQVRQHEQPSINTPNAQLLHLATFTDDPNPAVTRILFTDNDQHARTYDTDVAASNHTLRYGTPRYIKQLMREAGLEVREDPVGNIFGRLAGSSTSAAAIMTGSHIDAIPHAGAYDGTLGVVGGIAALAALKRAGFVPCRPLDVLMFTSEEPTRFGLSCLGRYAWWVLLVYGYDEQIIT